MSKKIQEPAKQGKMARLMRGNLNGEILHEITGNINQRNERKNYLLNLINNKETDGVAKQLATDEFNHIKLLEKDTSEKQSNTSFLKIGKMQTWILTMFLFSAFTYLIIHNATGDLNFDNHATQVIIGLITTLMTFWISILIAIFKKGAKVNIKNPKDKVT